MTPAAGTASQGEPIGSYRENAIAIDSEANDSLGGNVYYVTMQITLSIPEFSRNERNVHCDVLHITPESRESRQTLSG